MSQPQPSRTRPDWFHLPGSDKQTLAELDGQLDPSRLVVPRLPAGCRIEMAFRLTLPDGSSSSSSRVEPVTHEPARLVMLCSNSHACLFAIGRLAWLAMFMRERWEQQTEVSDTDHAFATRLDWQHGLHVPAVDHPFPPLLGHDSVATQWVR